MSKGLAVVLESNIICVKHFVPWPIRWCTKQTHFSKTGDWSLQCLWKTVGSNYGGVTRVVDFDTENGRVATGDVVVHRDARIEHEWELIDVSNRICCQDNDLAS